MAWIRGEDNREAARRAPPAIAAGSGSIAHPPLIRRAAPRAAALAHEGLADPVIEPQVDAVEPTQPALEQQLAERVDPQLPRAWHADPSPRRRDGAPQVVVVDVEVGDEGEGGGGPRARRGRCGR